MGHIFIGPNTQCNVPMYVLYDSSVMFLCMFSMHVPNVSFVMLAM